MDNLEYLLKVNKYYEDKAKLYESVESDSKNKKAVNDAIRNGDIAAARQHNNNIKNSAEKNYGKQKINRAAAMQKQKEKESETK